MVETYLCWNCQPTVVASHILVYSDYPYKHITSSWRVDSWNSSQKNQLAGFNYRTCAYPARPRLTYNRPFLVGLEPRPHRSWGKGYDDNWAISWLYRVSRIDFEQALITCLHDVGLFHWLVQNQDCCLYVYNVHPVNGHHSLMSVIHVHMYIPT